MKQNKVCILRPHNMRFWLPKSCYTSEMLWHIDNNVRKTSAIVFIQQRRKTQISIFIFFKSFNYLLHGRRRRRRYSFKKTLLFTYIGSAGLFAKFQEFQTDGSRVTAFLSWSWILKHAIAG